jgi:hypothetical protein
MKKSILFAALIGSVLFFSCSKDDDKGSCETCDIAGFSIEACDNGDGTVTISSGGDSETISEEELGGLSPDDYIKGICSVGDLEFGQAN